MDPKEKIIQAGQSLFSQFGLKKVTTEEIAREAKVSKTTVYRFYKNKQEVFEDVVRLETDLMINTILIAIESETTIVDKLKTYMITKLETICNLINLYRVSQESWNEHWPHIEEARKYFMDKEREIVSNILEEGCLSGDLKIANATLQAHIFVLSLKLVEFPWALKDQSLTREELVENIVDIFINGVRAR